MSAVSSSVTPRSIALWITLREVSRSQRWPKLLQPRPTAETRRPEPPRLRICMDQSCETGALETGRTVARRSRRRKVRASRGGSGSGDWKPSHAAMKPNTIGKKMRPRSDAATDGDRLGRVICDGGPDQTRLKARLALLRGNDSWTYPQAGFPRVCRHLRGLFRGAQMPDEAAIAAAAQRLIIGSVVGVIGMADEIGHRRVAQHASAVGQRRANEAQH